MKVQPPKAISLLLSFLLAATISGCPHVKNRINTPETAQNRSADTIQAEIMEKVSERILESVPQKGRLRKIRERGVIRVALPPPNPPFQERDNEFGLPVGFTPALATEIARAMNVKPNISILDALPSPGFASSSWETDYDLIFLPEGAGGCRSGQSTRYFFSGHESGWKTICATGDGKALAMAIREILSYLNETGIYARLYNNYVRI